MKIYVLYEFNIYEVINPPVRESVLADLRDSYPNQRLTLRLVKDPRVITWAKIKYVRFEYEW